MISKGERAAQRPFAPPKCPDALASVDKLGSQARRVEPLQRGLKGGGKDAQRLRIA